MPRPSHFEMPVDDPARAESFYRDVFGWTVQSFDGAPSYYGMVTTGPDSEPGINGGFFKRSADSVTSVTVSVESIEETLEKITAAGGSVVLGKSPIPSMGWFATCKDTEGNTFGLFTEDTAAG
ncbi:MAG: VOC family protein [Candidatus Dormibacteraeota bacterium]|uniref:Glyoxalase n=1 Tax=Candidatus Aeolococcus gillhamiae TaxID=3127015 RepID=A0A2W6A5J8_9BACT|nr:VOC family protein [Candidatus Dormibacteraeota bacterium]PZR78834.1 MAG: glyoxalase [Candidatus Dormibacter sp. RRmetagenome_bin12]